MTEPREPRGSGAPTGVVSPLTIFQKSCCGRRASSVPDGGMPAGKGLGELFAGAALRAAPAELPEVAEIDLVRHFVELSRRDYGVDRGIYPLGSCTMKYNPRVNERTAALEGFRGLHPYQPDEMVQGALELLFRLGDWLAEIAGLQATTLQPAAGAHGELTGLLLTRAWHDAQGRAPRTVLIPDTAHGTNPASVVMAGYKPLQLASDARGGVDLADLRAKLSDDVAGLMLTNPNTLGLFDENIVEIASLVHEAGGLLYYDGANANAILGRSRPGDMGFDIVHFNTHKTFSTPHGGGGPGAGPIVVRDFLAPFLPVPVIERVAGCYHLVEDRPQSIGKVRSFTGNFLVLVRAYTYIRALGAEGLAEVSDMAVLNANYVLEGIRDLFDLSYDRRCMHEFVVSATRYKVDGVRALDIAKRLLDRGIHPPTTYFPLIVPEALMIEPTETESRADLDRLIAMLRDTAAEAHDDPGLLTGAPREMTVRRLDEVAAARTPVVREPRERFACDDGEVCG